MTLRSLHSAFALILTTAVLSIVVSCDFSKMRDDTPPPPPRAEWMDLVPESWPQIALTNAYFFKDRQPVSGASSFLIAGEQDTFLCTAKHLLGSSMAVHPEVPLDSVNALMEYWEVYPRSHVRTNESLFANRLVSSALKEHDIMLFALSNPPLSIQPLQPRFTKLTVDEPLFVLGCNATNDSCWQNRYALKASYYNRGLMWASVIDTFDVTGFSGAPVIDTNGAVVGVLTSGLGDPIYQVGFEPIKELKGYLVD